MKNVIVKYGVSGGLIVSVLFLGPVVFWPQSYMVVENMAKWEVVGYTVMVLSMLSVFFGTRAYRNELENSEFTFLKGLGIGLQITIFANIIFYFANVLLYEVLAPGFLIEFGEFYKAHLIESAPDETAKKLAAEEFDAQSGLLQNSYLYALVMAATTFFIGIIISLISAITLKRTKT